MESVTNWLMVLEFNHQSLTLSFVAAVVLTLVVSVARPRFLVVVGEVEVGGIR